VAARRGAHVDGIVAEADSVTSQELLEDLVEKLRDVIDQHGAREPRRRDVLALDLADEPRDDVVAVVDQQLSKRDGHTRSRF
jgi:hypothetical protein